MSILYNSLPYNYVNNLQLNWQNITTISISPGSCRDSKNQNDIVSNNPILVNLANNGVNGLDQGTLTSSSTWYYVYIIGSSNNSAPTAGIASLSSIQPIMPKNYDLFLYIGQVLTDISEAKIVPFYTVGNGHYRKNIWFDYIQVLENVRATTDTALSCILAAPPINNMNLGLRIEYYPQTAQNHVWVAPYGNINSIVYYAPVGTLPENIINISCFSTLNNGNPSIIYRNSSNSDIIRMYITDFEYFI